MAANFNILSQKQNVTISPTGTGFQDVWEITYKVTSGSSRGTIATLTVPDEDHNKEKVAELINAKISALDDIASI